jgi:hypothetical protein
MKKRYTPQLVKFVNNKNEFYGFFEGKINATSGVLTDVALSNVTIYKDTGETLDLDEIIEMSNKFDEYDFQFVNISTIITETLPEAIKTKVEELSVAVYDSINTLQTQTDGKIRTLSVEFFNKIQNANVDILSTVSNVSSDLDMKIENVAKTLVCVSNDISSKIDDVELDYTEKITNLKNYTDNKFDDVKNEFEQTSAYFNNKILNDKHYSFNTVNTNVEPFKIKDFAINTIVCSVKDGSVFFETYEIGRVENVKKDDKEITSFYFVTFDNIKDENLKKIFPLNSTTYGFTKKDKTHRLSHGYNMVWDASLDISSIKFSLTRDQ